MMHRIFAPRLLLATVAVAGTVAIAVASPGAHAATTPACPGRALLTCREKQQIFPDTVTWTEASVVDFELFETRTGLPLSNPTLNAFWRFEASTAGARGALEYELGTQLTDADFEQVAPLAKLPTPKVGPHGAVSRKLARNMSKLMLAEQQEVLNLGALDTAMDRATYADYLANRHDWVKWQESAAAGFAYHAAAAIGRVIQAQRVVSAGLVAKRLLYGVGVEDLKLAQRQVRHHGLRGWLIASMERLGLTSGSIAHIKQGFLAAKPFAVAYSLSQLIASPSVIKKEQQFAAVLKEFSARIPRAGRPPT